MNPDFILTSPTDKKHALPLTQWISQAKPQDIEPVLTQMIMIDRFLVKNKMDYLGTFLNDLLVDKALKLYLICNTGNGQKFVGSLYDLIWQIRDQDFHNISARNLFFSALAYPRNLFYKSRKRFRSTANIILETL